MPEKPVSTDNLYYPFGFCDMVVTKKYSDHVQLAASQSGVNVEITGLPGDEYPALDGTPVKIDEGHIRLKVGRGATVTQSVKYGQRLSAIDKVLS